jgi:hypothetical protein
MRIKEADALRWADLALGEKFIVCQFKTEEFLPRAFEATCYFFVAMTIFKAFFHFIYCWLSYIFKELFGVLSSSLALGLCCIR